VLLVRFHHSPAQFSTIARGKSPARLLLFVFVMLALVLTGCGGEAQLDENRQFANERSTEAPVEPTKRPIVPDGIIPTETLPTALPPDAAENMLSVTSAPDGVMVRSGNAVVVVDPLNPESTETVGFAQGWELLAFAPSPAGGRLVGLVQGPAGELGVELRNTRGERLAGWDLSEWSTTPATPSPAVGDEAGFAISWTGNNERVLAIIAGSTLLSIDLAGEIDAIDLPTGVGNLVEASWSPAGNRIAMLGIVEDGAGVVSIVSPYVDGESLRQVIPPAADAANLGSVTQFAWLPDGSSLIYILAQNASVTNPGGNLYRLDLERRQRQVVATPGRGGPAAQIVDFAVAPDGSAVSYVIANPVDDTWAYHSLWIRSLRSALHFQVDTPTRSNVTGMWWVGPGFVWRATVDARPVLYYTDQRTDPVVVWDQATSEMATPVAASPVPLLPGSPVPLVPTSPVAQPDRGSATPQAVPATPSASPASTPGATPIR
jgi:hypothetical protein